MNINEGINSNEKEDQIEKDPPQIKEVDNSNLLNDQYKLGWNKYSEITNGRFAMIGFFAILIIELISNKSFLQWAGIIN